MLFSSGNLQDAQTGLSLPGENDGVLRVDPGLTFGDGYQGLILARTGRGLVAVDSFCEVLRSVGGDSDPVAVPGADLEFVFGKLGKIGGAYHGRFRAFTEDLHVQHDRIAGAAFAVIEDDLKSYGIGAVAVRYGSGARYLHVRDQYLVVFGVHARQ